MGLCRSLACTAAAWVTLLALPARAAEPPARTGFQMDLRLGWSVPSGRASGASGDTLAGRYSSQFPLIFDLGAKVSERVFVGGYLHFGFGTNGSDATVERQCTDRDNNLDNNIRCGAFGFHMGVLAQYSFAPAAKVDPWIGYGIGFETGTESIDDTVVGRSEQTTSSGLELARLAGGVDFRLGKAIGLGPFAAMDIGRFTHTRTDVNGKTTYDGSIADPAVHWWISLGARFVLFP